MQIIPQGNQPFIQGKQTNTSEVPAEEIVSEETETMTPEEKLSPKYAQLARKEQALRQKEIDLKAKEQRLASMENDYKTKYVPKEEIGKRFSTNFHEAAEEFGISYDQVTQAVLNQPSPESQVYQELRREIAQLKAERDSEKSAQVEAQKKQYDQAIDNIRSEATQLVETDPEFETIKETGEVEKIVKHIEDTYKETGKVLKVSEAAKVIEEQLLERALKVAKLKKVQEKLTPKADELPQGQIKTQSPQGQKTLTNNLTTQRKMTSRERAYAAFKGEL